MSEFNRNLETDHLDEQLTAQVLQPGQPGMLYVDGGCSAWPYVGGWNYTRLSSAESEPVSTREFNGAQYVALDGGLSEYHITGSKKDHMLGSFYTNGTVANAVDTIVLARQRGVNAEYIDADLHMLPFVDSSVDELFLGNVLIAGGMATSSVKQIIDESARVTKQGGMVVIRECEVNPERFTQTKLRNIGDEKFTGPVKLLHDNNFEVSVVSLDTNREAMLALNKQYVTGGNKKDGANGIYILARKRPEQIMARNTSNRLKGFLGRKALKD